MTGPSPTAPASEADELHRLTALYGSGLLEDGPRAAIDSLVALAASLLDCPVAMLNVIDRDTQQVVAWSGETLPTLPREQALCDHAIRDPDGLVVEDLAADPRFAASPQAKRGVRFYAGAPVSAPDAAGTTRPIGALCVTDTRPRELSEREREVLRHLARLADRLIAARGDAQRAVAIAQEHQRLGADLARQHRLFAQAERLTGIGSWRLSLADDSVEWSDGVHRIYGTAPGTAPDLGAALTPYPPAARGRVAAMLARAIEQGVGFDFEEDFQPPGGPLMRVRSIGEAEIVDGTVVALVGVFQDVTERHRMETELRRDADTDALTGLANRAAFDKALAAAIARAGRSDAPLLLALVDLDGFKAINDTLGHAAGDEVLRKVGVALQTLAAKASVTARIGGDEFALLVEGDGDDAALAAAIEHALVLSASRDGLTLACGGSVGTARHRPGENARDFVHRADVALYAAKRARTGERRRTERRRSA